MTTLVEHAKRIERMKAVERRVREWIAGTSSDRPDVEDVALLLERIDAYEASITWYTDCLTCPKLYDQVYAMEQHEIPKLKAALEQITKTFGLQAARNIAFEALR